MAVHFMAFLGTSLYEPVIYTCGGMNSSEQEFVQCALVELYQKDAKNDSRKIEEISIFVTKSAEERNWKDRLFGEKESAPVFWSDEKKARIVPGQTKKGLETQLREQFPEISVKKIDIDDAQNEEEIYSMFNIIYNEIREGDEIVFDVTHGYRSIPMLAMTIMSYAKVLKNCTIRGIYYGAYEASHKEGNTKIVPINNLTRFDEIIDWTNAAGIFMKTGNAALMRDLFNSKMGNKTVEEKKHYKELKKMVNGAGVLSDSIMLGRGADGNLYCQTLDKSNNKVQEEQISIKSAYQKFADSLTVCGIESAKEIAPLYPLFEKIKTEFSVFDKKQNYEIGIAVAKWSAKNGMIQQGLTALEETIKTYICARYHLNEIDKADRDLVDGILNVFTHLKHYPETEEQRLVILESDVCEELRNFADAINIEDSLPDRVEFLNLMFKTNLKELCDIAKAVKDARNDVNHFGMKKNIQTRKQLEKALNTLNRKFEDYVNAYPAE